MDIARMLHVSTTRQNIACGLYTLFSFIVTLVCNSEVDGEQSCTVVVVEQ